MAKSLKAKEAWYGGVRAFFRFAAEGPTTTSTMTKVKGWPKSYICMYGLCAVLAVLPSAGIMLLHAEFVLPHTEQC